METLPSPNALAIIVPLPFPLYTSCWRSTEPPPLPLCIPPPYTSGKTVVHDGEEDEDHVEHRQHNQQGVE